TSYLLKLTHSRVRCPLWVKSGHFALQSLSALPPKSGHSSQNVVLSDVLRMALLSHFRISLVRRAPGLRAGLRARLGAARQSLSPGWCLERRTHSARGLREIRQHSGTGVGGRQASNLWCLFLDQWCWPVSRPARVLLHGGCRRPNYDDCAIP